MTAGCPQSFSPAPEAAHHFCGWRFHRARDSSCFGRGKHAAYFDAHMVGRSLGFDGVRIRACNEQLRSEGRAVLAFTEPMRRLFPWGPHQVPEEVPSHWITVAATGGADGTGKAAPSQGGAAGPNCLTRLKPPCHYLTNWGRRRRRRPSARRRSQAEAHGMHPEPARLVVYVWCRRELPKTVDRKSLLCGLRVVVKTTQK